MSRVISSIYNRYRFNLISLCLLLFFSGNLFSQEDSLDVKKDSITIALLENYNLRLQEIEKQRIQDSLKKEELYREIEALKTTDNLKKEELQSQLLAISEVENQRRQAKKAQIDSLKKTTPGFPVRGFFGDTLFHLYSKLGAFSPKERADGISDRIERLGDISRFSLDTLKVVSTVNSEDIVYGEMIIMSVTEIDGLWEETTAEDLANRYRDIIASEVASYNEETGFLNIALKIGLAILILALIVYLIKYISKFFRWTAFKIISQKGDKIKGVTIKNYTLFDANRQIKVLLFTNNVLKWFTILLSVYIALPILFGIFPWTEHFASILIGYITTPLKRILLSFWNYLPNLITIVVIIIVFRYVLRGVRYLKDEIADGNLVINGFYQDWAAPTYQIVRVLLVAFMLVVIWPYLPGSDSPIFKGVSVFLGFLFTFGSAGSLSNVIAGLVLTYMRLFTIGDNVKIGEISGDVIEKSLLVTRIRTSQNEIISIPNSTVMNSHTVNYSIDAPANGLIIHTTVAINYNIPWNTVHDALIEAAQRTELILKHPAPYVLQTSLKEFYVTYQLNAYIKEANRQGVIYSNLHENIQDVFRERNIEIKIPYYHIPKDGAEK